MKKAIWISYDIGVRGDYEGLYAWLDSKGARECGDSVAFIKYEDNGNIINNLKKEIENAIEITKKMRIYVVYREDTTNKLKGKFLFGTRKAAPWTGFASEPDQIVDDEA
jgi:hypothetical protein